MNANNVARHYVIALNNASGSAELMSDFSYIEGFPRGVLTFDFTHMAAPLTQETRDEYLPAGFGYQPTQQLLEVTCAIAAYTEQRALPPHELVARLPSGKSRTGRFLVDMHLPQLLGKMGLRIESANPASTEMGRDDARENLIPLTSLGIGANGPDFSVLSKMHARIATVFQHALPDEVNVAERFTSIVNEAVDNLIEYGQGGIIGGLYYPRVGEVEISLINRCGGFGGTTPSEELKALVAAYEGQTRRSCGGGNGIAELSRLAITCFGTLVLRNGSATLRLPPDGSVASTTEETGFSTLGASVTILLQLLPVTRGRMASIGAFEAVLVHSLETYATSRGGRTS